MNAVCLVIDGLHRGFLGCCGNAWVGTPGWDRLASEALVLDGVYIDSPDLASLYRSYWLGRHAARHGLATGDTGQRAHPLAPAAEHLSLPRRLAERGVATRLVTDAAEVADYALAPGFGHIGRLPLEWPRAAVEDLEETHAARFFAGALDALSAARPPYLLWLHAQGMAGPWDAPRELRERYAAEDDPPPPDFVLPPAIQVPPDADPDLLLGIRQAYAAQVAVIDSCLDLFLNELTKNPHADSTLLIVVSARGFPLGVHGRVGHVPGGTPPLYGDLTNVPCLLRFPNRHGAADRSHALAQPADIYATLLDWFQGDLGGEQAETGSFSQSLLPLARGEASLRRDRAAIVGAGGERALRTPAWYARFPSADVTELYVKPDDRWEINDVASRCGDVAEGMRAALTQFESWCAAGAAGELPPLDEVLVRGLE